MPLAHLLMGAVGDTGYDVVLVLHILAVVAGIGAVTLNGLYAAEGRKRPGPAGRAISEANFRVSSVAKYLIYTIPVTGIALVFMSDDAWDFGQTWIWLSIVLYVMALGISHSILIPGHKRINALLAEMEQGPPPAGGPPPQLVQIQALGKRQATAGMTTNLLTVVLIALMVFKPGTPG